MRIITWNINSVRLRINLVEKLNNEYNPDIICLQEAYGSGDEIMKFSKALGYPFHYQRTGGYKIHTGSAPADRELLPIYSMYPALYWVCNLYPLLTYSCHSKQTATNLDSVRKYTYTWSLG